MLEWSKKVFKAVIISMSYEVKLHTLEINGKVTIIRREIENTKKLKILEVKNTISELKKLTRWSQ